MPTVIIESRPDLFGSPIMPGWDNDVLVIYRLWLPVSVLVIGAVIGYSANLFLVFGHSSIHHDLNNAINSKYGLIEIATAVALVLAIFQGTQSLGPARAYDD